jgi:hypothetical protein
MNTTTRSATTLPADHVTPGMEKYREAHAAHPVGTKAEDPQIKRMERMDTTWMEPMLSGDSFWYSERTEVTHRYMCRGCGLVWEKKHQARNCESRGHKTSYQDGPYGRVWVENGKLCGNPTYYTRSAVRREKLDG